MQPRILFWETLLYPFRIITTLEKCWTIITSRRNVLKNTKETENWRTYRGLIKFLALNFTHYSNEWDTEVLHKCFSAWLDLCHAEDAARKFTVAGADIVNLQNGKDRGMVEIQRRRQLGGVIFFKSFWITKIIFYSDIFKKWMLVRVNQRLFRFLKCLLYVQDRIVLL